MGSFPRKQGMERKELLGINGKIFVGQGKALAANAAPDVRVLVVGNPCNTNCLVGYLNGRDIPPERWTAMTRLDHNRAKTALAKKAGVPNAEVTQMTIWGNHSNTQFPDFTNARIGDKPATEVLKDRKWLEETFVPMIQTRGAAVIKARGASSALSAANGALDHVKSLLRPTLANDWLSAAVISKGQYGVPAGLVFSYPCRSDGRGNFRQGEAGADAEGVGGGARGGEGPGQLNDGEGFLSDKERVMDLLRRLPETASLEQIQAIRLPAIC